MAGYCGYSKSNNALQAESEGKVTASELAKRIGKGATAAAVKAVVPYSEWHHTSSHFNKTYYYDFESSVLERAENRNITEAEAEASYIAEILAASKKDEGRIFENCSVTWIEWCGSRKHPKAIRCETVSNVIYKGGQFVEFQHGTSTIKKKIGANGFKVAYNNETIISDYLGKNF